MTSKVAASVIQRRAVLAERDFGRGGGPVGVDEGVDEGLETEVDTVAFLGDGCDMSQRGQNDSRFGENRYFTALLSLSHVSILVLVPIKFRLWKSLG